ncbi:MAG: HD domain-containing protein [Nitrospirota bacterium]
MKRGDLSFFRQWFSDYCASFYSSNKEDQKNIVLKEQHTAHVCSNIVRLAQGQALNDNELLLAETAGLFHDVGRFPQYAQYRTFRDSASVNHGELGAKVLEERQVLKRLPEEEQQVVITVVKFHNTYRIPDIADPFAVLLLKLVRDADKLDIWRVFFEYYDAPEEERASVAGLGLPDSPEYSKEIVATILKRQLVPLTMLRTLTDFKMAKMAWVFDLNFTSSFKIMVEHDYLKRVAATLPQTEEIKNMTAFLLDYIHQRIQGATHE